MVQDLASITAFIERKRNLPGMTFRDANANPMTDYFDFRRAAFAGPPRLAEARRGAPARPGGGPLPRRGLQPAGPDLAGQRRERHQPVPGATLARTFRLATGYPGA